MSANGWTLRDVSLSRACSATSWENFFLSQSARLSNFSSKYRATQLDATVSNQYDSKWSNVSLIHAKLQDLASSCTVPFDLPLDGKWEPDFQDITTLFQKRVADTMLTYQECLTTAQYYIQDIPCDEIVQSCCSVSRHYDPNYAVLESREYLVPGDILPANKLKNDSNPSNVSCDNIVFPPAHGRHISFACYIDAVANVTTPGFSLTVRIQRYTR